jgi:hypothetical protein
MPVPACAYHGFYILGMIGNLCPRNKETGNGK